VRRNAAVTSLLALTSRSSFERSALGFFGGRRKTWAPPGAGEEAAEGGLLRDSRRSFFSKRWAVWRLRFASIWALRKAVSQLRSVSFV
jgi:hypothetical protein